MRSNADTSSGAKDTVVTFLTRLMVMAVSLGVQVSLAWLLGPTGRGAYAVCTLFAMVLGMVFTLSVDRAGQYLVASGRVSVAEGVSSTLVLELIGSAVGVIVGLFLIQSSIPFFAKAPPSSFRLALVLVPLNVLSNSVVLLLIGVRRFVSMGKTTAVRVLTHLGATLILVWGFGLGVNGALIALVLGNAVSVVLGLRYLGLGGEPVLARPSWGSCVSAIAYGARYWIANLSNQVHSSVGTIILAWFVTTSEIGFFAAATGLAARVLLVPDAIEGALFPRTASDPGGRPTLVAQVARVSLMTCGIALAVIVVASRPIVTTLFSRSFLPVVSLIPIIALGVFLRSGSKVLMPYFMGVNRPAVCSWAVGLATVANIGALVVLLPRVGLVGAAWAMTIGYSVSTLVLVMAFRAATGLGLAATWLPQRGDATLVADLVRRAVDWLRAGQRTCGG